MLGSKDAQKRSFIKSLIEGHTFKKQEKMFEWFLGIYHPLDKTLKSVRVKLWDSTGQEKYIREMAPKSFFRSIDCVVVIWDAASIESFQDAQ